MSKIVTLKEGDMEIYPVTSAEVIFDKVKNRKYLRVPLYYAKDEGRILLWGIKGKDMGI